MIFKNVLFVLLILAIGCKQENNQIDELKGLIKLSSQNISEKNFSKASLLLLHAEKIALRNSNTSKLSDIYYSKGLVNYYTKHLDSTLIYMKKSVNLSIGDDDVRVARCYKMIGLVHVERGYINKALEYYLASLKITNKPEDSAGTLVSIGNLYKELKEYKKANTNIKLASTYYDKSQNYKYLAQCFNNLGISYHALLNYDSALIYYQKALKIKLLINDTLGISTAFLNKGELFLDRDNLDSALYYLHHSLEIRQTLLDKSMVISVNNLLGETYRKDRQFEKSKMYLLQAAELLKVIESRRHSLDNYKYFKKLYQNLSDYKQAMYWDSQFDSLNKIYYEAGRLKALKTQSEYDIKNEETKTQLAEQEAQIQQQLASFRFYVILVLCLAVLIIILLLYFTLKNKSKVELLNKKVEKQNNYIKALNVDTSHKTSNSLILLNSLLRLQAKNAKEEPVKVALQETSARLETINQVHSNLLNQNLDLEDTELSNEIFLQNYLEEILKGTFTVVENKNLDCFELSCDSSLKIKMNTAWSIGLIINELATNFIKHCDVDRSLFKVAIHQLNENLEIEISDNGGGYDTSVKNKQASFGMLMIDALVTDLDASLKIKSNVNGTRYELRLSIS